METRKLITATDNQYSGLLLKALDEQRGHGLFCDVTIIVEDRKFRAHRNVLSASSSYFQQLFSVAGQVVELSFLRAEIFAEILNYIYTSKVVRVRSDMLNELIASGQLLGVKFLADLGGPLQQVKSMSGSVKPGTSERPSSEMNGLEAQKPPTQAGSQNQIAEKPAVTEAFSLHGEACDAAKITISDSDDDDVIFCSEIVPPKDCPLEPTGVTQSQPCPNPVGVPDQINCTSSSSPPQSAAVAAPRLDSGSGQSNPTENQVPAEPLAPSAPKPAAANVLVLNPSQIGASPDAGSSHEIEVSPIPEENQQPSNNDSLTDMETIAIDEEDEDEEDVEDDDDILGSSSPGSASSSSLVQQPTTPKPAAAPDATGVPKKHGASFPQESASQPREFKMKIPDVLPGSNKDAPAGIAPKHVTEGQKTITLDTAAEIEGLSTGCKVYANIGEDTYDIVIPVKDEADGEVRLDDMPRTSGDDSTNRKRLKVKHDDHYELIMDGKVYYICIVCKRSYVCLTSLRRHFNVHSWEKKYKCRYCDRVFPLAEYRTKHEIKHTGERRYQCLTCGDCFINYQVMATHIRSVHSQDPSAESKLYHLHPCRSLQIRNYAYISDSSSNIPMVNNNALVYPVDPGKETPQEPAPNPPAKPMTWDDIFVPQGSESLFKQNPSDGSTEFEFVIPESY